MARRPNYGFQKQQNELKKQKKRDEKDAKKRLKAEGPERDAAPPADEDESENA